MKTNTPTQLRIDEWGRERRSRSGRQRLLAAAGVVLTGAAAWALWVSGALSDSLAPTPSTRVDAAAGPQAWALAGRDTAHAAALPVHDGYEGREAWRAPLPGTVRAGVAVSGGHVFLGMDDNRFVAFDAADGAVLWERGLGLQTRAAPAVTRESVYVAARDGELLALDRRDGSATWRFQADSALLAAPVVHGGAVYVGAWSGALYALDAQSGELLWTLQAPGSIATASAIHDELMALPVGDRTVLIVDLTTGRVRLDFNAGQTVAASPAFADGLAVVGTAKGRLIAVDPEAIEYPLEEGARFWRRQFFLWGLQSEPPTQKGLVWERRPSRGSALSPPAALDGAVYTASRDGRLHAYAVSDGALLWEYDTGAWADSSPAIAGDFVYVGNDAGEVHVVDRRSGAAVDIIRVGGSVSGQIVATEGALYVTTNDPPAIVAVR